MSDAQVDQQMSQFGQLRASSNNDYSQSSDNAARTLARRQCLNPGQASAPTRTGGRCPFRLFQSLTTGFIAELC